VEGIRPQGTTANESPATTQTNRSLKKPNMNAPKSQRFTSAFAFKGAALGAAFVLSLALSSAQVRASDNRAPQVPDGLQVPEGNKVHFHGYAVGVQIYVWTLNPTNSAQASWVFKAPEAVLFADAGAHGEIAIHYAGPTWESESGSKVVGTVLQRSTPDSTAIPWLLLEAKTATGPGIFRRTTYIQRVNTIGGIAPVAPGTAPGQEARVPYTADYYFYRSTN
jgi:hypothetical protein